MKISTDDLDIAQEADWQKAFGLIEQEMKKLGLR